MVLWDSSEVLCLCLVLPPQQTKTPKVWNSRWPSSPLDYNFASFVAIFEFRCYGLMNLPTGSTKKNSVTKLSLWKAFYALESVPLKSPYSYRLSAEWLSIIIFLIFKCIYVTLQQQLAHMNSRLSVFLISVAATYPLFFNPGLNETSSTETNLHND